MGFFSRIFGKNKNEKEEKTEDLISLMDPEDQVDYYKPKTKYQKPIEGHGTDAIVPEKASGPILSEKEVNTFQQTIPLNYEEISMNDLDDYIIDAGLLIIRKNKASIGMLQGAFKIGFNRAARIMDQLADMAVVGSEEGIKPRKILMSESEFRAVTSQINMNAPIRILKKCESELWDACKSETISQFISLYEQAIEDLKSIQILDAKTDNIARTVQSRLDDIQSEYQWKLRDAIERMKRISIQKNTGLYRNSNEHRFLVYQSFWDELKKYEDRYSDETKAFADKAIEEVFLKSGIEKRVHTSLLDHSKSCPSSGGGLEEIDKMNGIEFEYWCADLIGRNGFTNIEVTPASNDQGVDILAKKDGIKYAFQCKCYSTDLGNTPVQEVNAGKVFYNCHVGVVMTNRFFTPGAIELADKTGVLLWDRNRIAHMVHVSEEK